MRFLVSVLLLALSANADTYMQYPRGSNNRLNEQTATRTNGNRLFDSQNNARGGYNGVWLCVCAVADSLFTCLCSW